MPDPPKERVFAERREAPPIKRRLDLAKPMLQSMSSVTVSASPIRMTASKSASPGGATMSATGISAAAALSLSISA